MTPVIKNVIPSEDYTLKIEFENGEKGILDIKKIYDFGVFKSLKEKEVFKRVKISFDTIEWEGGIDLDPEYIYANCKKL